MKPDDSLQSNTILLNYEHGKKRERHPKRQFSLDRKKTVVLKEQINRDPHNDKLVYFSEFSLLLDIPYREEATQRPEARLQTCLGIVHQRSKRNLLTWARYFGFK